MPTLTIDLARLDGARPRGRYQLTASPGHVLDTTGNRVLSGPLSGRLSESAPTVLAVPATNDPTLNPTGFTYTLALDVDGADYPEVTFPLTADARYEDLAPVASSLGTATAVGPPGPAAGIVAAAPGKWTAPYQRAASGTAMVLNKLYLLPVPWFPVGGPRAIDGLAANCTIAAAGATLRYGLYGANAYGDPDLAQLLAEATTLAEVGSLFPVTFAATLPQYGLLWAAVVAQGAAPTFTALARPELVQPFMTLDPLVNTTGLARTVSGVSGALPTSGATVQEATVNPWLALRAA